jgi:hypothetical protein
MRAAVALICLALPAAAQQSPAQFSLPAGCDAYLTVQRESCRVEHHYKCLGNPVGHKWDVTLDQSGVVRRSLVDDEAQWLQSVDGRINARSWLERNPEDPHSITDLLGAGVDTFDFRRHSDIRPTLRFVGRDALTGRQVDIDGVTLSEVDVEVSILAEDGTELIRRVSREYVSEKWRMFFSGVSETTTPTQTITESHRPIEFIFPGEPGFLSTRPKYGCGVAVS